MEIKKFNINNNNISLAFLNGFTFLIFKTDVDQKFLKVNSFIKVSKIDDSLVFTATISNKLEKIKFIKFKKELFLFIKDSKSLFKKKLILKGLGFKINFIKNNNTLEFKLGFSHLIQMKIPESITVKLTKNILNLEGFNKILLGNIAHKIISLKTPDCYKGKGFWYKYQKKTLKVIKKK